MPWPTADDVQARTGIGLTSGKTDYGLDVTELLSRAKSFAESYCRREFDEKRVTEIHDGGELVVVRRPPIVEVESVKINGEELRADEYYVYEDYVRVAQYRDGRIAVALPYGVSPQAVEITYTGGYSDLEGGTHIPIPGELKEIVLEIASRWLLRIHHQMRTGGGAGQLAVGNVSATYIGRPEELADLLARLDVFRLRAI